jgi:sensor histidine kinase YesM
MKKDHLEPKDTKIIQLMVDNKYKLLRHAVLLMGVMIIIYFSHAFVGPYRYFRLLGVFTTLITLCYINMYILAPRFFFRGRYILYLALLVLLALACEIMVSNLLTTFFPAGHLAAYPQKTISKSRFYEATIILIAVSLVTTMIKLFQQWVRDNERMNELRNITLTMELNELRNQINPHFLFNMLNGINALIRSNPEKATIVIMKLSEFLRYQLYENNEEKILLRSEINFLSNFLELEKLRRDNLFTDISSQTTPRMLNSVFLPPNLFTTFVENAIKHSVNIIGAPSYIRIEIAVKEHALHFSCVNSKDPGYKPSNGKNSGLGLANIKRRLELLYGSDHHLEITSTEKVYDIKLTIPL